MKYRTKLMIFTGCGLLVSVGLVWIITLVSINQLGSAVNQNVETGLTEASREYFSNYIKVNASRTDLQLNQAVADVQTLAGVAQTLEDHKTEFAPLFEAASQLDFFQDKLEYNQTGGWFQSDPDRLSAVSLLPYLLGPDGQPKPEVLQAVRQSSLLNLFFPLVQKYSLDNVRVNFVAAPDVAYIRTTPWNDYAGGVARTNPKVYRTTNLWNYQPPGVLQTWRTWAKDPTVKNALSSQVTFSTPYRDTSTGKLIMTVFHPIWSADRQSVSGSVSINLSLDQIAQLVESVKLAGTGFAFLAQSDGNVLAVTPAGEAKLGLTTRTGSINGYQGLNRYLNSSQYDSVASLALPTGSAPVSTEITINGQVNEVMLLRLSPLNFIADPTKGIKTSAWVMGFIAPKEELLTALRQTQATVQENTNRILFFSALAGFLTLAVVVALLYWFSGRLTGSLANLTGAARQVQAQSYDLKLDIKSKDEFSQLGRAFEQMALEIKQYTTNLEALVSRRTQELEKANQEISFLNKQLSEENLRMRADLEVTRRIQQMILPRDQELKKVSDLDIATYMEPADEVSGDYYDVFQENGLVKIGIGDVTGHGLESGILMVMVQTVIRTLLASRQIAPGDYLSITNSVVFNNMRRINSEKNLSLLLIDYQDNNLYLRGQHEEVVVVRHDGRLELINTLDLGFIIGLEPNIDEFLSQTSVRLDGGDMVLLYTDGVTEAENAEGRQYGLERLCQVVLANHLLSAAQVKDRVIADLHAFIGDGEVLDDITILIFKQKQAAYADRLVSLN
jgi:sigma-B regulation protein RsbU (phosphoserine phosphatase)